MYLIRDLYLEYKKSLQLNNKETTKLKMEICSMSLITRETQINEPQ
jgi:hypothetical protein